MWWRCLYACGWGWRWVQTDTLIAVTDRQTCSLQSPLPYISLCGCAVRVVLQFVRWRRLCASRWRWWGQTNMLIAVTDRQTDMLIAILRSPAWLCVCAVWVVLQFVGWRCLCASWWRWWDRQTDWHAHCNTLLSCMTVCVCSASGSSVHGMKTFMSRWMRKEMKPRPSPAYTQRWLPGPKPSVCTSVSLLLSPCLGCKMLQSAFLYQAVRLPLSAHVFQKRHKSVHC